MAGTPRDAPPSILCSPNPARGGGDSAFAQRQPSWGPAGTPVTPGSRYLQPLQAPRSDGSAARWKNVPSATECPPLPMASALFAVRAAVCGAAQYAWQLSACGTGPWRAGGSGGGRRCVSAKRVSPRDAGLALTPRHRSGMPSDGSSCLSGGRRLVSGARPAASHASTPGPPPDAVPQEGAQGAPPPPDAADTWVTVFGFQPEELETVLREFQVR